MAAEPARGGEEVHGAPRSRAEELTPCYRSSPLMAAPAPRYDLMLLLDPKAEDATRAKIRADVRGMIEAEGTIVGAQDYGARTLAYEIDHGTEAEYDLLQFEGPRSLLEHLQRTLHITDGVVRFRVIKVRPGTPEAPDLRRTAVVEAPAEADADAAAEPVAS